MFRLEQEKISRIKTPVQSNKGINDPLVETKATKMERNEGQRFRKRTTLHQQNGGHFLALEQLLLYFHDVVEDCLPLLCSTLDDLPKVG
ncbi:hypothetical protein DGG96_08425 [Legionella qingyii]|uniref:Uncharacterized protein n=1 Tax=Legionella qingyii TaxID=2184757 RepID=A0A317U4G0_9GAMM|nr:hypothetical protein DGG96_08425 [Legionella qingyii]